MRNFRSSFRTVSRLPALILILLLVAPASPRAGERSPPGELLTLEQALDLASRQNRQVANARLEVEKAGYQASAARRQFLPSFEVKLSESYLLSPSDYTFRKGVFGNYPGVGPIPDKDTRIAGGDGWDPLLMTTVAQPLSQLYKIHLGVETLELGKEIAREGLRSQRMAVAGDVKRQYHTVAVMQDAVTAAEEMIKALEELERVVKDRASRRMALDAELLEVKAQRAKAEHELLSLRHNRVLAGRQLNNLLGRDLQTELRVEPFPEVSDPDTPAMDMPVAPPEARPELRASRLKVKQAENEIKMKKSEYIPDVSLVFYYLSPFDSDFLPKNVASVGVQLTWDVFDWGKKKQELNEKHRSLAQARNQLLEAEAQSTLDLQNRMMKVQESASQIRSAHATREVAREKLRNAMNRFKTASALLQEVLQSQAVLAEANVKVQKAFLDFITSQVELDKAMGVER